MPKAIVFSEYPREILSSLFSNRQETLGLVVQVTMGPALWHVVLGTNIFKEGKAFDARVFGNLHS